MATVAILYLNILCKRDIFQCRVYFSSVKQKIRYAMQILIYMGRLTELHIYHTKHIYIPVCMYLHTCLSIHTHIHTRLDMTF